VTRTFLFHTFAGHVRSIAAHRCNVDGSIGKSSGIPVCAFGKILQYGLSKRYFDNFRRDHFLPIPRPEHEKLGHLLPCGRLPPTSDKALKHAFDLRWTKAAILAFTRVEHWLTSSPVLVLPDFANLLSLSVMFAILHPFVGLSYCKPGFLSPNINTGCQAQKESTCV
jgi:hypothetical protein